MPKPIFTCDTWDCHDKKTTPVFASDHSVGIMAILKFQWYSDGARVCVTYMYVLYFQFPV